MSTRTARWPVLTVPAALDARLERALGRLRARGEAAARPDLVRRLVEEGLARLEGHDPSGDAAPEACRRPAGGPAAPGPPTRLAARAARPCRVGRMDAEAVAELYVGSYDAARTRLDGFVVRLRVATPHAPLSLPGARDAPEGAEIYVEGAGPAAALLDALREVLASPAAHPPLPAPELPEASEHDWY